MPKFIFFFIPAIFIVLLLAAISGQYQITKKPTPISPLPPSSSQNSSPNWQTYQDPNISFSYPSTFKKTPSGYTYKFIDSQNGLSLSLLSEANYNQVTGKEYSNIDDYIGMPNKAKEVIVDGQSGRRPLPRAGSENIFSAVFFSKDMKTIYTIELKAGGTPLNVFSEKVTESESIFNQILLTIQLSPDIYHLKSPTAKIGYIKKIYANTKGLFVDIDYVEWVDDPTQPDGYKIVNNNTLVRTFKILSKAEIYCLSTTVYGSDMQILPSQLSPFLNKEEKISCSPTTLFRIDFDNNANINWMRQVYTP